MPTMFEQSRYWRVIQPKSYLKFLYWTSLSLYRSEFLSHGYVWMVSDARGAGASFGDRPWEMPPLDISDSKEIMDWIVKQPWSNGDIGGGSDTRIQEIWQSLHCSTNIPQLKLPRFCPVLSTFMQMSCAGRTGKSTVYRQLDAVEQRFRCRYAAAEFEISASAAQPHEAC